jgi:hypothetical protein
MEGSPLASSPDDGLADGSMGIGEILPPEFCVLLVGKVKSDLAGLALNHHVENLPVLEHLYPTCALGEPDQGFIAVKSGSARQRRAHSVSVEEDHVQAFQYRKDIRTL